MEDIIIINKREIIRKWLENNQFFNIKTTDSIFMTADGISNKMVVIIETNNLQIDINEIKVLSQKSGRQLWKADVEEQEIHWEIL